MRFPGITAAEAGASVHLYEAHQAPPDLAGPAGGRPRRRRVPGGDMVAAPGLLSEVAFHSAVEASRRALSMTGQADQVA